MAIYRLCGVLGVTVVAGDGVGVSSPTSTLGCSTTSSTVEGELTLRLPTSAVFYVSRFTVHVKSRYLGVIPTVSVTRINMH